MTRMEVLREIRPGARPETDAHRRTHKRRQTRDRQYDYFGQMPLGCLDRSANTQRVLTHNETICEA